jgi:hypothetical protein
LSTQTTMGSQTECTAVVQACDKALADQDRVISLKTKEVGVYKEIVAAQDTRIAALEKEKGGLLRSPWFYFGLGLVAGGFIMKGK